MVITIVNAYCVRTFCEKKHRLVTGASTHPGLSKCDPQHNQDLSPTCCCLPVLYSIEIASQPSGPVIRYGCFTQPTNSFVASLYSQVIQSCGLMMSIYEQGFITFMALPRTLQNAKCKILL